MARHLRLVDADTGEEVEPGDACAECAPRIAEIAAQLAEAEAELRGKRTMLSRLRNTLKRNSALDPEGRQILEVLEWWRVQLHPRAKLVRGDERWGKVADRLRDTDVRTGQPIHSVVHLKAAVMGCKLSTWHMEKGHTDATTIFKSATTTQKHIDRATLYKASLDLSVLSVAVALESEHYRWLAERCSCGHTWLEHLRGGPTPDGLQPCSLCTGRDKAGQRVSWVPLCGNFDAFSAKVDRWMREHGNGSQPA